MAIESTCILLVGLLLLYLFEHGILDYPYFLHADILAYEVKLTFFMLNGALLFYTSHFLYLYINTYQLSGERLKRLVSGYTKEINELRMQPNPYFLYNYLINTEKLLHEKKLQKALEYNASISTLLEKQLTHVQTEFISLEEEINWLKNYLGNEKAIIDKPFSYTITIADDELLLQPIPPFLLQPIVEGILQESVATEDNIDLQIDIQDLPGTKQNGIFIAITSLRNKVMDFNQLQKRISIINLEKRIALINNLNTFQISSKQFLDNGTFSYALSIKEL